MKGPGGQPRQQVIGPRVSAHWLPHVIALGIIAYWLVVKSVLFHRLEYTSDLFSNLELTRSFFDGRPLLWENAYGDNKVVHNLYIAVLFYPFTRFLGAYGLFVAEAALYGGAVCKILSRASATEYGRELYWAVLAAIALGPVAFWIWDNPIYGFHYELVYVPLSVLFAVSLLERSRWAWIFAALIVLIREEGAVVAWCIHALHELLNSEPATGGLGPRSVLRRLAWITGPWLLVFIAGMALLLAMGASHGRLGSAPTGLRRLVEDSSTRSLLVESLGDAGLLLAAGAVVYLAGIPLRGLAASILVSLALIVPAAIGSSIYGSASRAHGIAWPPRFAMLWGVALAGCLFAIERVRAPVFATVRLRRTVLSIAVAGSIVAQVVALGARRNYDFLPRFTLQTFAGTPRFVASLLSSAEDAFLGCLGRDLPSDTPVATTGGLFGRFHRQDLLWPDRLRTAWKLPELVVCDDAGRIPFDYGCINLSRSLPGSYDKLRLESLSVRYAGGTKAVVEACAARAKPAGRAEQL
jgi:hypothetical protein